LLLALQEAAKSEVGRAVARMILCHRLNQFGRNHGVLHLAEDVLDARTTPGEAASVAGARRPEAVSYGFGGVSSPLGFDPHTMKLGL
jgi:hypothetical protein